MFVFLLTVYLETGPKVYVAESSLSAVACMDRMQDYAQENPEMAQGTPSCEFDSAELQDVASMQD